MFVKVDRRFTHLSLDTFLNFTIILICRVSLPQNKASSREIGTSFFREQDNSGLLRDLGQLKSCLKRGSNYL